MSRLVDVEDEEVLDKLAMKILERELKQKEARKRQRRSSSSGDDEDMDDVTLETLSAIKKEFTDSLTKVRNLVDTAFGRLNGHDQQIKAQKDENATLKNRAENFSIEIDELRKDTQAKLSKMQADLASKSKVIEQTKVELNNLRTETDILKSDKRKANEKIIDLEARSRRNNLIFHGIPDPQDHDEDCTATIMSFIEKELKLNPTLFTIQRAHRLGAPRGTKAPDGSIRVGSKVNTPRPIIVNFVNFLQREKVRKERTKLSSTYGISEDLPAAVRDARKSISDVLKRYKSENKRATILYPCRLLVEGQIIRKVNVVDFY